MLFNFKKWSKKTSQKKKSLFLDVSILDTYKNDESKKDTSFLSAIDQCLYYNNQQPKILKLCTRSMKDYNFNKKCCGCVSDTKSLVFLYDID